MTASPVSSEARKTVTVLFADVVGSTTLGHDLDPESLRSVMSDYFAAMRVVLERHGGVVQKFIGDAVLAVFGVPRVHEDDAIRAVRAAADMGRALTALNVELERSWGLALAMRTGVNTGEVLVGDSENQVMIGDAVNVAARLEQTAEPGEVLLGEATYRLVRDAVAVTAVGPLGLKGKPDPVPAWRLLEVHEEADTSARRLGSGLVGRDRELAQLHERFARRDGCEVVTVIGPAGVGKSRLAHELAMRLGEDAAVVHGRCLPYGEGITFWPVAGVLRDAAGIAERDRPDDARAKLARIVEGAEDAELLAGRLSPLLGVELAQPGIEETFWAVRRLFEHLAAQCPLLVVFDDVHWGEPTFLELLEYLADRIRSEAVLFLCLARAELIEARPGWMSGKANATTLTLEPLAEVEIDRLITNLLGGAELADEARSHIAAIAEGNPLFVEETLRMLVDDGLLRRDAGAWTVAGDLSVITVPPTIEGLLRARLDRLIADERAVIERAAVVGREFWWGAVAELCPEPLRGRVIEHLQALTRKELIRPDHEDSGHEAPFRFAHILIQEAAYSGIPKADRAELHERLADWIEAAASEVAGEYEEIVGHHLEQAARLRRALAPRSGHAAELGRRAAAVLARTGRRAYDRGDMPAAVNLLARAVSLLTEQDRERAELLPQLAFALFETGEFERLQAVVDETTATAAASGAPDLAAYAQIVGLWIRLSWNPEGWVEAAQAEAASTLAAFEAVGDERGLAKAWALLGLVHIERAQFADAEDAWEHAAVHAHQACDRRDELESLSWIPLAAWAGPRHVDEGIRRCREVVERARGDRKVLASALMAEGLFEAELGHFDAGRALIGRARALLQEVALTPWLAGPLAQFAGWTELLAGNPVEASRELRWGYDTLHDIGELSWLSTLTAILAEALYAQGRDEEAERLAGESEASAGAHDAYSYVMAQGVRAKLLARRGTAGEAERLAREAVARADGTDFLHLRWYARLSCDEVLRLAGREAEGRALLEAAIEIAERKGSAVGARRARGLLSGGPVGQTSV